MYRARRPSDGIAGYHTETISSRALTPVAQGSGREVSVSHKDVIPTGHGPVGSGRYSVGPCPAGASPASAEIPMPPIITGRAQPHQPESRRPGCSGGVRLARNPSRWRYTTTRMVPGISHTGRYERALVFRRAGEHTMSDNPAAEALGVAVAARVPVLLWGAPGTGKTSAIRAMADAMDLPCETVIASIREPSDFAGLPIVVGGEVRFAPPAWARRLAEAGHGLLFLDELSTAPPAVQAALLRVVLERAVGDLTLPDEVAVVAAANPPEQAADGWDLSAPLANRLCHLAWQTDPRSVADGLAGGWAAPVVPELPEGWQAEEILSRGLVAAFLHVRPALACAPPTNAAAAGRGWPSPRTWEMAGRLMAAAGAAGASDEARSALIRGAVGDGAGVELLAWLVEMDLPDPERVLADPASFRLPERGDRAYAALAAIAAAVAADPTPARWTAGWQVLGLAADTAPDVAAVAARVLAKCRPPDADPPAEIHLFAPVLRDAGLL